MKKTIAIFLGLWLLLIIAPFYSGWQGRQALVDSQRAGCARGKLDRTDNAHGWRTAEKARRQAGEQQTADTYRAIAEGLERRSRINCTVAFPDAPFLKLGN